MEKVKILKNGKTYILFSGLVTAEGWDVPLKVCQVLLSNAELQSHATWEAASQALGLDAGMALAPTRMGKKVKSTNEGDIQKFIQKSIINKKIKVVRQHIAQESDKETGNSSKSGNPSENSENQEDLRQQDKNTSTKPESEKKSETKESDKESKTGKASDNGATPVATACTGGEPISMISGEELLSLVDTELPGPLPFQWKRTFRTSQRRDIGLGVSWTHSACEQIVLGDGELELYDSEGRIIPLALPQIGQASRYVPEGLTLLHPGSSRFILKQDGQPDKVFDRIGAASVFRLNQLRHAHYRPATSEREASGFAIDLHYNKHNRLTRIMGNWGQSLVIERDGNGHATAIDLFNEQSGNKKRLVTYAYNDLGELITQRNAQGVGEDYHYDHHLIKKRTTASGINFHFDWDGTDSNARCLRSRGDNGIYDYKFEWDPENNKSKLTDSRGNTFKYKYNEYGLITEEIDGEGARHQYKYDRGRKVSYIDPLGNETRYFFDKESKSLGYKDALGHQESLGYFKGKLTRYTDKNKACWQYEYNSLGQLAAQIDPSNQRTEYAYNKQGQVSEIRAPGNRTTRYHWQENGYLKSLTDADGHKRSFSYDDWGQVIEAETRLLGQVLIGKQQYSYTPTGKLESVTDAQGKVSRYIYNRNDQLIQYIDPQGRSTQFEYDGLSQVVKRIDAEGNCLSYEYDKERNLTALMNENGERYSFEYDGNERLTKETGFDGRKQHYKYNEAGQLIRHLDAGEIVTDFERDALGRMLTKSSHNIADPNTKETSRFAYDAAGGLTECYNTHHYLEFEYSHFGKAVREHIADINDNRKIIKGSKRDIHYDFIWPDLRAAMQLPDGQKISYNYDEAYRLGAIQHNGQLITQIQRDEYGREKTREQGALTSETEYDPHSRLQKQTAYNKENKSQKPIERNYGYDEYGNLNLIKDGPVETRYVYDMLNRLKLSESVNTGNSSAKTEQEIFHFDPAGNRLNKEANKTKGNRLTMMGDRKFSYDARGNLVKEKRGKEGKIQTLYHYNLSNQLIKVEKAGQTIEYRYDPLGRRTQKSDEFGSTKYLWAGDQIVQEERANIKKTYIFEPESFKPVAMLQDDQVYHYHLDHLGTPRELSANDGSIVWKARYKTYGNAALKEVEEVENNLRFQGQYFDEETGFHYNRHRYYDPCIGQFTTQDPIGLLGGENNYQYAPNPTGWIDPLGLFCKEQIEKALERNNGTKIVLDDGTIEYHFKSRKDAMQAASEVLGNMGNTPIRETIPEAAKKPEKLPHKLRETSRIYSVTSSDGTRQYRDDLMGHTYDPRPHLNVEDFTADENLHFYYGS